MPIDLLSDLNPQQKIAVTHGEGPLLIVAGVGTGKTTVITRRIAWLISDKRAKPAEILALTFTEKAAAEMEERVDVLVPYGYVEARISTFHSFCDRVLRENAVLLGLDPAYDILTEAEQAIFLKNRLFELPLNQFRPLGNPMKHLQALLSLYSRAKDENTSPEAYLTFADELATAAQTEEQHREAVKQRELAMSFAAYQRLMLEAGKVDFGDLICLSLQLFREHPDVLRRYQEQFRYVLVDEFQDTNHAQFELLRMLSGHRNLTACGDDDQSIYQFRGAAISNILEFLTRYPDADQVVLTENYRSPQPILDASYRLIQHNNPDRLEQRNGISKRLHSARGNVDADPLSQHHFESLDEESDFVAKTIRDAVERGEVGYSDCAVLVRANAHAQPFLHAMNLARIPWRFSGSRGLYDRREIRAAIAFLRVLADPSDTPSLHYVAASPPYELDPGILAELTALARRRNRSLYEILHLAVKGNLSDFPLRTDAAATANRLVEHISAMLHLASREPTGNVLYAYLQETTGLLQSISNSPDPEDSRRIQNLAKLFSIVERFSRVARYDRVPWFIDYLDALIEAGDNPPEGEAERERDAVDVLTVHQAKGLEFSRVFLVGLVDGRFPSRSRRDLIPLPEELGHAPSPSTSNIVHQQEERRLFYVGMTRAKDRLYLTGARDLGGRRLRKPSQFVCEALDLPAASLGTAARSPVSSIMRHALESATPPGGSKQEDLRSADPGPPLELSHNKIDEYLTCPLRYRYNHVLHVPTRLHHAIVYGSAIHRAIRLYNTGRLSGRPVALPQLRDAFRAAWRSEGFLTERHEQLRMQEGLEALGNFFAHAESEPGTPIQVEQRFSISKGDIRIVGVFDRIDQREDGAVIIDYKTKAIDSQQEADKLTRDSLQLALYAIAYEEMFGVLPARLELRFLTPKLWVGQATPSSKMLEQARASIDQAARGIRAGNFAGEPRYGACRYCPYAGICPHRRND
ncbi:UvrD-helicase domain-containing protein [Candidatus Bipolaricaulota bacterium]|nr:UvrD-helicase domain-containing protein [Candidatus Bipolaricaulota bacterium]